MSHFRYIVDFKIGSYSNCKYKSFVLNVIKSINPGNYVFLASRYSLQSSCFKENILSGLGIGTNILHLMSSEAQNLLLSNFFEVDKVVFEVCFRLCIVVRCSVWFCDLDFCQDIVCYKLAIAIVYAATSKIKNLTNRLTLCIFYTMNDNFITEYFGIGIKMVKPEFRRFMANNVRTSYILQ
jgi:hypothetical protein